MSSIIIHTDNEADLNMIIQLAKRLNAKVEIDETEYLLSSEENKNHLKKSIKQAQSGETSQVDIDSLWK